MLMASALIFPKIDGFERGGGDLGRSLTLAALVARNGPPDHFVPLAAHRAPPCPPAVIRERFRERKRDRSGSEIEYFAASGETMSPGKRTAPEGAALASQRETFDLRRRRAAAPARPAPNSDSVKGSGTANNVPK